MKEQLIQLRTAICTGRAHGVIGHCIDKLDSRIEDGVRLLHVKYARNTISKETFLHAIDNLIKYL